MEAGQTVQAELEFRGAEFSVRVSSGAELLEVEVSDMLSADQWRGQFDSAYIEDLTRKTGNFKQFAIFCTMLESALTKSSESVTLDLLTYSDLEGLRSRKAGLGSRPRPASKSPALNAKRYLILIYSVEFDRIHYPLPLPYQGKPDPARLQREIRELREELRERGEGAAHTSKDSETHRLRAELAKLRQEKEVLAGALERMQAEGSRPHSDPRGVRVLKDVVHSLEEELLRERTRNKRAQSKREQEYRQLQEQLEELKESERSLRVRVKSLTNELALCRKGQRKVRRDLLATPPSSERGRPRSRETRPLGRRPRRGSRGPKQRMSSTPTRKNPSSEDKGSAGVHEEPGHTSLAMTPDPSAQLQEGPDPDPSISRVPESDPSRSRVPESDPSISRVPESDPSTSRVPESDPSISRVPESDPSTSRVPESDPSISRVPESDPSTSRVPESDPSISRVPESDPSISEGRVCLTRSDPDCEP
ncbi:UNVERIFIED_CONTAM: hypothetical protein FKN15_013308 [Acipenser sinensis]